LTSYIGVFENAGTKVFEKRVILVEIGLLIVITVIIYVLYNIITWITEYWRC